jgi:hypothetical protein
VDPDSDHDPQHWFRPFTSPTVNPEA